MIGSGTSIALLTGLSMVVMCGARDAVCAWAPAPYSQAAELPPPQDLALAIVKILMVRKIGTLEDSILVPLQESFGYPNSASPTASPSRDMAETR